MAINISGGTDKVQYAAGTVPHLSGIGTFSVFIRTGNTPSSVSRPIFSCWNSSSRYGWGLIQNQSPSNTLVFRGYDNDSGGGIALVGSTTIADSAWHHVLVTMDGNNGNSNEMFLDGSSEVSGNAGSDWPTSSANLDIFGDPQDSFWESYDGDVAEAAYWDGVHLDAAEIAALNKGFPPALIRPASLSFYSPMIRGGRLVDQSVTPTETGIVATDHPPVIGGFV